MQGISCTVLPGWRRGCLGRPETDTCDLRSLHTDPVSPSDWTETQSCRTQTLGKCRSVQILSVAPSHLTVWTPQAIHKGYAGQAGSCSQLWPQAMHQIPPVAQMAESAQGVPYVKVMPGRDLWSRRGAMQKGPIPLHQFRGSWLHLPGSSCTLLFPSSGSILCVPFKVNSSFKFNWTCRCVFVLTLKWSWFYMAICQFRKPICKFIIIHA